MSRTCFGAACLAALLSLTGVVAAGYTSDPIAFWRLDELAGLTAAEDTAGADGTYHNVLLNQPGVDPDPNRAVYFDGHTSYVEIPHAAQFLLDQGAVEFCFRDVNTQRNAGLLSKDSSGYDTGGHLTFRTVVESNVARVQVRLQSTTADYVVTSPPYVLDTWYKVTFTFGPAGMNLFFDDMLVDSNPYTGGLGTSSGGAGNFEPIVLGANSWASGDLSATPLQDFYSGLIDQVKIYDNQVPEPATMALLAIGGVALALRRRR